MNGFLEWFKANTKMKRWMFLIIVGIILTCYGISEILVFKELSFIEVGKIVISFVVGFTSIILGIVFIQKRTLELLVEASDTRAESENQSAVKSLIFNKKVYDKGPNIVVIGGGSGLNTVLKGIKNYTSNITAIVTVSNYGNMPTDSRKELEVLPLGDIKESLIALSKDENSMEGIMNLKFDSGKLKNLSFSDIYFSAMEKLYGNFTDSIEESKDILNIVGRVLPVTLDEMHIVAELQDGTIIEQKDKIAEIVYKKVSKINRIYLSPTNCRPAPGVLEAIENADAIVIGPGSLYTNVIPNLLVKGVSKAIKESKAMKIYVTNIMTEPGQTDNYSVYDHINTIIEHAGRGIVEYCIYDTGEIIPEIIKRYNKEGADLVEQDISKAKELGVKLIQRDLAYVNGEFIRHNPASVAESIIELICEDLKFKDSQNTPEYFMMNTRLKESKIKNKSKAKPKRLKEKRNNRFKEKEEVRKPSKFGIKYKERIETIKNADKQTQKNKKNINKQKEQKNIEQNEIKAAHMKPKHTKIEKLKTKK